MQLKVNVNQKSVLAKLKVTEELIQEKLRGVLKGIADDIVDESPVDTGAYVLSHTFAPTGSGAGRSYSSHGKPRNQDVASKREEARGQLYSEIETVNVTTSKTGIFRNRAPHARPVEDKHSVYTKAKDRAR